MKNLDKILKVSMIALSFIGVFGYAQAQQRTIHDGGNWSDTGSWVGGNIASTTGEDVDTQTGGNPKFSSSETMTVDGDFTVGNIVFFDQILTVDNNNTLTLGSQALFDGGDEKDFTASNNVTININTGASMIIYGDLIVNNNLTLNVTGTLIVKGDLVFNNGGDLTVDGSVEVDGTIDAGNNSTLSGTGTVSAGDCTGDPDVCGDPQLPIELAYFNLVNTSNGVICVWATTTEENNDFFTVERSVDGISYESIGTIEGAGNSTEVLKYEFVDKNPLFGQAYYRLTQTDFDGTNETFKPKSIYISTLSEVAVHPNPIVRGEKLSVFTTSEEGEKVVLKLYNSAGMIVGVQELSSGANEIKIDSELNPGLYVLKVQSGDNQVVKRLLIK